MKLTLKLSLTFLLGLTLVLAVYAWSTLNREADLFSSDMQRDNLLTARVIAVAVEKPAAGSDSDNVKAILRRINLLESPVRVRWVSLDPSSRGSDAAGLTGPQRAALSQGRQSVVVTAGRRNGEEMLTYVPVPADGLRGAIEVAEPMADLQRYIKGTFVRIATTTVAIVLVCGLLVVLIGTRLVGRPVSRLVDGFRRVAIGDLAHRPEVSQRDELGELAVEFGAMCDQLGDARKHAAEEAAKRLEALEQLRHADRLRTVGQLTAGVAHELGTPLNVVWARASMIARGEAVGDEARGCAMVIEDQSQRMTRIIRSLLEFARPRPPQKALVDLRQIAQNTLDVLGATARKQGVSLELIGESAASPAEVDAGQIQQVLSNLVLNAIQAMSEGGQVTVGVGAERVFPPADVGGPEAEFLCLFVQDQGPGIAEADLPKIFEPFFTTKEIGEGTGLGLSISRGIIREHGGWIAVTSSTGRGARFTIYLPRGPAECAVAS
jgi:two-component system NtrC family sensor kinase